MFGPQQAGALADYIQAALMLRYNKRLVHQLTEADFNDDWILRATSGRRRVL